MDTLEAVNYILENNINGCFVECGVESGAQPKIMAEILLKNNQVRDIWMYDTFQGLTKPGVNDFTAETATLYKMSSEEVLSYWESSFIDDTHNTWCFTPIDTVKNNINKTGYPEKHLKYVIGDVMKTLEDKGNLPEEISLLRLDTDWYDSSLKEMEVLFPKVVKGGVVIFDDYFHWDGQRKATDEYFEKNNITTKVLQHNQKVGFLIKE